MTKDHVRLEPHHKYRVWYRLENQKLPRFFVGDYLGWSKFYTQHEFSLRPTAGTSQLRGEDIIAVEEVPKSTANHQPMIDRD